MSVNKAILLGNLGKDPELSETKTGKTWCKFSMATTDYSKNEDGTKKEWTVWHNIVAWGKLGETMAKYLKKGQQIYLEGRINNRSYEDKDGTTKYISEISASTFQFTGKKGDSEGGDAPTENKRPNKNGEDLPF